MVIDLTHLTPTEARRQLRKASELTEHALVTIRRLNLPEPTREHRFHPTRKWRFDLAWPTLKLALECEGGTWVRGAHSRGKHFESDCEKYAEAVIRGWRVLRATTDQVKDGTAAEWVARAMGRWPILRGGA